MRLFIGIEFPPTVITALADCQDKLRMAAKRGRFKKHKGNFHITLKFLGEVAADSAGEFTGPLTAIAQKVSPFSLQLGRMGRFGNGNPIRVIWVDVAGDTEILNQLQTQVEQMSAELGFKREQRRWQPHITLAQDVDTAGDALQWSEHWVEPVEFKVSEFALILSEEKDRRRIYTPIQRFVLDG